MRSRYSRGSQVLSAARGAKLRNVVYKSRAAPAGALERGRRELLATVAAATAAGLAPARGVSRCICQWPRHRPLHRHAQHHWQRARLPERAGPFLRGAASAIRARRRPCSRATSFAPSPSVCIPTTPSRGSETGSRAGIRRSRCGSSGERQEGAAVQSVYGRGAGRFGHPGRVLRALAGASARRAAVRSAGTILERVLSAVATVLFLTGLVVWWPGSGSGGATSS